MALSFVCRYTGTRQQGCFLRESNQHHLIYFDATALPIASQHALCTHTFSFQRHLALLYKSTHSARAVDARASARILDKASEGAVAACVGSQRNMQNQASAVCDLVTQIHNDVPRLWRSGQASGQIQRYYWEEYAEFILFNGWLFLLKIGQVSDRVFKTLWGSDRG